MRGIPNLHVLNPDVVTINEVRFVGASLWFPDTPDEVLYRGSLNDFKLITDFVPWVHDTHAKHLAFLKANVRPDDVVVTHLPKTYERGAISGSQCSRPGSRPS